MINFLAKFQYLVINKDYFVVADNVICSGYFVKEYSNSKFKYTDNDIISMFNFCIYNLVYIDFGGVIFNKL